jgi:hypothetical protein
MLMALQKKKLGTWGKTEETFIIPVLIVCTNIKRHVRICEHWQVSIWFRRNSGALNILVVAVFDINRRLS